uniref:Uncharacterized protein n=1 Tax=Oryza sativa subsp. japonica TaxID=39947 RepID=Q7EY58_ORYSJ|nr:hypothetical protein [Oryza sativa Japonica Group]
MLVFALWGGDPEPSEPQPVRPSPGWSDRPHYCDLTGHLCVSAINALQRPAAVAK